MRDVSELLTTQNNQNIFFPQHSEFPVQKENICITKPYRIVLFLQQIIFFFFFFPNMQDILVSLASLFLHAPCITPATSR